MAELHKVSLNTNIGDQEDLRILIKSILMVKGIGPCRIIVLTPAGRKEILLE